MAWIAKRDLHAHDLPQGTRHHDGVALSPEIEPDRHPLRHVAHDESANYAVQEWGEIRCCLAKLARSYFRGSALFVASIFVVTH